METAEEPQHREICYKMTCSGHNYHTHKVTTAMGPCIRAAEDWGCQYFLMGGGGAHELPSFPEG